MTKKRYCKTTNLPVPNYVIWKVAFGCAYCGPSSVFLKSPLFTLFLDCVWQMMNQYPAAFEFTEAYLTVLTDSMWIPLFSTFLFNSPKQRNQHLTVRHMHVYFGIQLNKCRAFFYYMIMKCVCATKNAMFLCITNTHNVSLVVSGLSLSQFLVTVFYHYDNSNMFLWYSFMSLNIIYVRALPADIPNHQLIVILCVCVKAAEFWTFYCRHVWCDQCF